MEIFAVIGLGYVGLPVAVSLAEKHPQVIGFDIDEARIQSLKEGHDATGEVSRERLTAANIRLTSNPADLERATFHIVTVPTPIDSNRQPDLGPLKAACTTLGPHLALGSVVVFESTVYPGVTEECCGPLLEHHSGLQCGRDFRLAYSPERINPGDRNHSFEKVVKVVSAQDEETLERVAAAYSSVVQAGVHRAPNIKTAEAAKVIENTQRDLNIALMNELALIFDRMDIRTRDVLAAARTKWNFLPFTPGLVGGHCIGVDPYYLTSRAESIGYHPQVILAGRRINDGMGVYVAQKLVKMLVRADTPLSSARVGILGLTFKENVPDLRNSRVPDIITELQNYRIIPQVSDPLADPRAAKGEYDVALSDWRSWKGMDALILAVAHQDFADNRDDLVAAVRPGGIIVDVKSLFSSDDLPTGVQYWSL